MAWQTRLKPRRSRCSEEATMDSVSLSSIYVCVHKYAESLPLSLNSKQIVPPSSPSELSFVLYNLFRGCSIVNVFKLSSLFTTNVDDAFRQLARSASCGLPCRIGVGWSCTSGILHHDSRVSEGVQCSDQVDDDLCDHHKESHEHGHAHRHSHCYSFHLH